MAFDKLVDSTRLDGALTATANAILSKTGSTTPLAWDMDDGFKDAIEAISTGGVVVSDTTDTHGGTIRTITTTQTPVMLQAKTGITPGASAVTVTPDNGYNGMSSVQVNGDVNLVAGNIKNGTTIFGVTGTYSGSGGGGTIKRIAGSGMNNAVNVSGWSTDDFEDANVIDANDPKFLIAHVTVNNIVRSFAYAKAEIDTTLMFEGSKDGVNWGFSIGFTITKTNNNINTISLTYESSQATIGAWEIISNLPTYTPTQGVSFTLILKDYDGSGTDYEADVSNFDATTWGDLINDFDFADEYGFSIIEDSYDNSPAVYDPIGIGMNMTIHNSDDPNDDYTLITDAIIDGHTYYAYYAS